MKNTRAINVRILFVALIGIISGILFFYLVFSSVNLHKFNWYIIPFALLIVINIVCLLLKLIKSKQLWIAKINKHFVSSVAFAVMFLLGVSSMALRIVPLNNLKDYTTEVLVKCEIEDVTVKDNYCNVTIKNITIDGNKISQNASLITYYDSDTSDANMQVGDILEFKSTMRVTPLYDTKSNIVDFLYGRAYTAQVDYTDISITKGTLNLAESVRSHVHSVLQKGMNEDNSAIAYSMLFGSKEYMSKDVVNAFSYSGVAHILAVSGLHIGVLVVLISSILKKLRVNRVTNLIIVSIFLIIYCYLCNFTPSVTRASIMSIVFLLSNICGKEYDALSSLSLAAIIILLMDPLNLMSLGFQLSFLCVLSIITLSNSINRLLTKLKLPKIVCETLAISICINIVILPLCANAFEKVSLVGALANIVILPLFSIAFPLLFVFTLICSIIPPIAPVLWVPNILLHVIKVVANFFANISHATYSFYHISYLVLICAVLIILAIKYLMVSKLIKGIVCSVLGVVMCTTFAVNMISNTYGGDLVLSYQYNSNCAIVSDTESNYLIGVGNKYLSSTLKELKIRKLDYIIGYDIQTKDIDRVVEICKTYSTTKLYLPEYIDDEVVDKLKTKVDIVQTTQLNVGEYKCLMMYDASNHVIGFDMDNGKYVIVNPYNTTTQTKYLLNEYVSIKYLIANRLDIGVGYVEHVENVVLYNGNDIYDHIDLYKVNKFRLSNGWKYEFCWFKKEFKR